MDRAAPLGATLDSAGRVRFLVWAPNAQTVEICLGPEGNRDVGTTRDDQGYAFAELDGAGPGTRYRFRLDGQGERPDPASRSQPEGVHGPSEVIYPNSFRWNDGDWKGLPVGQLVIYELHVGTFTPSGTFDAVLERLDSLAGLGITAIELMPVAQFPGSRNWGYDGVYPFAVQNSYGGLPGLQRLVDACHSRRLAVLLDVVYNHLGPEGNHLPDYGPYFTDRYQNPWGRALNFDGAESDHVRRFFLESAEWLVEWAHLDGVRVDAVHAIVDNTAGPFLRELTESLHRLGVRLRREVLVIAESSDNDPRLIRPPGENGFGFDAVWSDDLHHALHAKLTGERNQYYVDYGQLEDVRSAYVEGFVLVGQYSQFRRRRHGVPTGNLPPERFVVASQNHDQVGNRPLGDRLHTLVPFEAAKLAAGVIVLSPFTPLIFMGEEYADPAPFLYFTSHGNPTIAEAVRRGRQEEFAWAPPGQIPPDPQDEETFHRSKIHYELREAEPHRSLQRFYAEILRLRAEAGPRRRLRREEVRILPGAPEVLEVRWIEPRGPAPWVLFNFSKEPARLRPGLDPQPRRLRLASSDRVFGGPGGIVADTIPPDAAPELSIPPLAVVVYVRAPSEG